MSLEPAPSSVTHGSAPRTSAAAVWSLVLGILSITCLWILGSIPAIILGIVGMRKVAASPETVSGRGLALAGIITGSAGILIGIASWGVIAGLTLPAFSQIQNKAHSAKQISEMRVISVACQAYALDKGGKFPAKLEDLLPDYLADASDLTCKDLRNPGSALPYLYRPGLESASDATEPFLMSPVSIRNNRAVAHVDGSVTQELEPLPQELLDLFE